MNTKLGNSSTTVAAAVAVEDHGVEWYWYSQSQTVNSRKQHDVELVTTGHMYTF